MFIRKKDTLELFKQIYIYIYKLLLVYINIYIFYAYVDNWKELCCVE